MPLADMIGELQGSVPNQDAAFARTLINEAWADVRRLGGWSFQFGQTGFTVPGLLGTGLVTLEFGSLLVVGDAAAVTAWTTRASARSMARSSRNASSALAGLQGPGRCTTSSRSTQRLVT